MRLIVVSAPLAFTLASAMTMAIAQEPPEVTESIRQGCIRQGLPPNCRIVPIAPMPAATRPRMNTRSCSPLEYPIKSKQLGETGSTIVKVSISREGAPSSAFIEKSSGSITLDEASTSHVLTCRFEPARRGDVAVQSIALIPYDWKLEPMEQAASGPAK